MRDSPTGRDRSILVSDVSQISPRIFKNHIVIAMPSLKLSFEGHSTNENEDQSAMHKKLFLLIEMARIKMYICVLK